MLGRVSISTLLLLGAACDRGSATSTFDQPSVVRVAAAESLSREALESGSYGHANHAIDLITEPAAAVLDIKTKRDREIVLVPRAGDPQRLAERLRYPGLISTRVEDNTVVATLPTSGAVARFDFEFARLAGGTHRLGSDGLVLLPNDTGVALELVPAPSERHWRLLNGGHVDIVPLLERHELAHLARTASIDYVQLPVTGFIALALGDRFNSTAPALEAALDIDTIAAAACDGACRAHLPINADSAPAPAVGLPAETVELIFLAGNDSESFGARIIAHQLLECGIEIRLAPVSLERLSERIRSGDYQLALLVSPTSRTSFQSFLELMGIPEDKAAERLIPLWNHELFAAYDRSICNVHPDSVTSWRWLADVRRCEEAP